MTALVLALCAVAFVLGVVLWIVGKAVEGHYVRRLRRIEREMTPEQWAAWGRERPRWM